MEKSLTNEDQNPGVIILASTITRDIKGIWRA